METSFIPGSDSKMCELGNAFSKLDFPRSWTPEKNWHMAVDSELRDDSVCKFLRGMHSSIKVEDLQKPHLHNVVEYANTVENNLFAKAVDAKDYDFLVFEFLFLYKRSVEMITSHEEEEDDDEENHQGFAVEIRPTWHAFVEQETRNARLKLMLEKILHLQKTPMDLVEQLCAELADTEKNFFETADSLEDYEYSIVRHIWNVRTAHLDD